jgi:hypothetical protein
MRLDQEALTLRLKLQTLLQTRTMIRARLSAAWE